MTFRFCPNCTNFKLSHLLNANFPKSSNPSPTTAEIKFGESAKTLCPIVLTVSGIVTVAKPVQ